MRQRRLVLLIAITLSLAHVAVLAPARHTPALLFASNLIQILAALTAAISCVVAARRSQPFARTFWWLVASAFALWSVAQGAWTLGEMRQGPFAPGESALPTDVLFFFSFAPFVLALLLNRES